MNNVGEICRKIKKIGLDLREIGKKCMEWVIEINLKKLDRSLKAIFGPDGGGGEEKKKARGKVRHKRKFKRKLNKMAKKLTTNFENVV